MAQCQHTHPFAVLVFAFFSSAIQVHAIEAADGDCECKLNEVHDRECEITRRHAEETHPARLGLRRLTQLLAVGSLVM